MTHFVCIAIGQADFLPDAQDYFAAETAQELQDIIANACRDWESQLEGESFYAYDFRMPRDGENNYSQRLRISAGDRDFVLDVIGMTQSEYERESA